MNWKYEMERIEQDSNFLSAIQLLRKYDEDQPELFLRVMFLLLDFVVEGKYTQDEHDNVAEKLKVLFDTSYEKFVNNSEFLFFAGVMAYMGEWYFGMDSIELANSMLEKAMKIENNNTLYKWGYYAMLDQRPEQNTDLKLLLSEQLLNKETYRLDWLKSKGLLGKYILGILEGTYEALKAVK